MKRNMLLTSLGVLILGLSLVGVAFAAPGDILSSFSALPGTHAHGGAASGGLVWQNDHDLHAILEFDCIGTLLRTIPLGVGGGVIRVSLRCEHQHVLARYWGRLHYLPLGHQWQCSGEHFRGAEYLCLDSRPQYPNTVGGQGWHDNAV